MAAVIKTAVHVSGVDTPIPISANAKIYGVTGLYALDLKLEQNGVTVSLFDNSGRREVWFNPPLQFAAASKIIVTGSAASTVAVVYEEE